MKKKWTALSLCCMAMFCMTFGLTACGKESQKAEEAPAEEGLKYHLSDDGLSYSVSGVYYTDEVEVVIPSSYEGLPVKSVRYYAFYNCIKIKSVVIPESVTEIGERAFYGCNKMISLNLPDSLVSIGNEAFCECKALTSIIIGNRLESFGGYALYGCSNLRDITYSGTVEQWNAVEKGAHWKLDAGDFTIHCTDGDISKE